MISCNDPVVGQFATAHTADHVPQSAELIILLEVHLHARRPRPYVVGKRQRALPLARRVRAGKMLENWSSIMVGERRDWNLRHLCRLLGRDALAFRNARQRSQSRRPRIPREFE